ncbi:hypothetical protein QQ020_33690 [Fulvivirgaceae bacterium BMA12]|uniref:Deoxyhypusine synthase n=1 Tax=Agaribacillus aureus TaxID=3051825 RepID=A0ABT8LHR5_9BACT|nr:hypothetical protein [Fulvivirgaceae bacterium BMA12]
MTGTYFDRSQLKIKPLSERHNKVMIEKDHVPITHPVRNTSPDFIQRVNEVVMRIKAAKEKGAAIMLTIGAHTIKNGMAPTLIKLMEEGWITHLATNGAGIIHDWEFAFQGLSSEDVRTNVDKGEFGIWEETGRFLNLALVIGAFEGKGYGESVGSMIENEGVQIPTEQEIDEIITNYSNSDLDRVAAALDLLDTMRKFQLNAGWLPISFPFKKYCVQAAAYRLGVPFTGHPMIGHDIIYTHPLNHGAAIGRTSLRDFLKFAHGINNLEGGVYMSVGSAVMSPMIFEKSLSMAQNVHLQNNAHIDNHYMVIVDLAANTWDWSQGEPPDTNPAYYLRYLKTFSRMGGVMKYLSADNRDFLLAIYQKLNKNVSRD